MHSSIIVLAFAALSTATPCAAGLKEGEFYPAKSTDARSPCPMLNVLANHGFLPRDGRNISKEITRKGMKDGLNLGADFSDTMFDPAVLTNPYPNQTTFDLDMLNRHNLLEHDGSLSRADAYWDDSQVFNRTVYEKYLTYFKSDTIDVKEAAEARMGLIQASMDTNPTFFLNSTSEGISLGETAAYMVALGNLTAGTVPLDRVKMMFEEERLPIELGWSAPEVSVTLEDLAGLMTRLTEAISDTKLKARVNGGIHAGMHAAMHAKKHMH